MVKQAIAVKPYDEMMADYYVMSRRCAVTGDYDPFLPLLRYMERDMDDEDALWYSSIFIAYYNPGSAWIVFNSCKKPLTFPKVWNMPLESARRSLQGGRVKGHLRALIIEARRAGGIRKLYSRGFGEDPYENWGILNENLKQLPGNGRWVGYIFGGILRRVHDFNVIQPDMGVKGASGPLMGLRLLTGESTEEAAEKLLQQTVKAMGPLDWSEHRHVPNPEFDIAIQESTTCDFNSMNKGRYYIGRDFDRDQYRIRRVEKKTGRHLKPLWDARAEVFPNQYLGELNGWEGIQKNLMVHYINTKEVFDR